MTDVIDRFEGVEYGFLSNFWGKKPTAEHYYQAAKTNDPVWKKAIMDARTPGMARSLGRSTLVKAVMRPDWDKVRVDIMLDLQRKKYSDPDLARRLLGTGDAMLIEGNYHHDDFWGDCRCRTHRGVKGKNMLGILLMVVREELRQKRNKSH